MTPGMFAGTMGAPSRKPKRSVERGIRDPSQRTSAYLRAPLQSGHSGFPQYRASRVRSAALARLTGLSRCGMRSEALAVWKSGPETQARSRIIYAVEARLSAPSACYCRRQTWHSSAAYLDVMPFQPNVSDRLASEWCTYRTRTGTPSFRDQFGRIRPVTTDCVRFTTVSPTATTANVG